MSSKKHEERLFDLRTLDSFLTRGVIKASEYDKHLKALPDETGNYEVVVLEEESEEDASGEKVAEE